jgi:hypothetical protein
MQEAQKHLGLMFPNCGCEDMVVEEIFKELDIEESMNNSSMKLIGVAKPFQKNLNHPPRR